MIGLETQIRMKELTQDQDVYGVMNKHRTKRSWEGKSWMKMSCPILGVLNILFEDQLWKSEYAFSKFVWR